MRPANNREKQKMDLALNFCGWASLEILRFVTT